MKIVKILASNSKQFRVYGMLKQLQTDDDKEEGWPPNTKFHRELKITSGLENSPGFDPRNSKMTSKLL